MPTLGDILPQKEDWPNRKALGRLVLWPRTLICNVDSIDFA